MDTFATLAALAEPQEGAFTTAQARDRGVSADELCSLVRSGRLIHPMRGAYALAPPDDIDEEDLHRLRCRCALLVYPRAVLCAVSSVIAHGVAVSGVDLTRPTVRREVNRGIGVAGVLCRRAAAVSVTTPLGAATPIADAVVELAIDDGMLAGVVSADAAIHAELLTTGDLQAACMRVARWPGASRAKAMLRFVDGRSESVGESLTRVDLALAGITATPQVEIRDTSGHLVGRVDLLIEGTTVIVEFDGRLKYTDTSVLWAEKKREDRLRRLGYTVVRVTWSDLMRPGAVARRVRAALAAA